MKKTMLIVMLVACAAVAQNKVTVSQQSVQDNVVVIDARVAVLDAQFAVAKAQYTKDRNSLLRQREQVQAFAATNAPVIPAHVPTSTTQ